tara:strand:+ start:946 stop:1197 length:252 start_codon:yes stop_codon:yes gene_type:complete
MRVQVVKKKLGRLNACGVAYCSDRTIVLDPRIRRHGGPKGYLGTVVHEVIHLLDPHLPEDEVIRRENTIASVLWKEGYRKIEE